MLLGGFPLLSENLRPVCDGLSASPGPGRSGRQYFLVATHLDYFRVMRRMKLAKSRREVSTFYFDDLFIASLRAGYLKRLDFDFCLHLDRKQAALARFFYGHIVKRIGEKSLYPRNLLGFLRDCGLSYIANLEPYRRNAKLKDVVFPALDLLKGEAIHSYELDDRGNIFFIPKS